jgi:hypothetical protein
METLKKIGLKIKENPVKCWTAVATVVALFYTVPPEIAEKIKAACVAVLALFV